MLGLQFTVCSLSPVLLERLARNPVIPSANRAMEMRNSNDWMEMRTSNDWMEMGSKHDFLSIRRIKFMVYVILNVIYLAW